VNQTFAIVTLGCKTNQFESAAMAETLSEAGYTQVDLDAGADLVLVNTCTVTANTDAESRKIIRRTRRINPASRIIVTGCYAQVDPESLATLPGVSLVLGNWEKNELLEALSELKAEGQVRVGDIRQASAEAALEIGVEAGRSRAFLQIQNGCEAFCSYCIIPYARGRSRSVEIEAVLNQVDTLVAAGHRELVLTGIHIGQYGKDLYHEADLLELLKRIEEQLQSTRLRLGSLEPTELPAKLHEHICESPHICPHYHIPLQSGNDRILAAMNRNYITAEFAALLQRIRDKQPQAGIGIDLIVGFPGETEAEFEQTYAFVESLPVTYLHVFPYSRRPGTPAASLPGQVPGDVAKLRAARIRQLGEKKQRSFARMFVGRELDVIVEKGESAGRMKAVADNYLRVTLPAKGLSAGQRLNVRVERFGRLGLEAFAVAEGIS